MRTYHKLFRQINRWLPLTISVISLAFSGIALRDQTQQSKTRVWQDFRREWDRDLKPERIAFAEAFQQGDISKEYGHVMTFFETLGFLVRSGRMDDDIFDETFSYDFIAYFNACKPLIDKDRAEDTAPISSWQNVYTLAQKYNYDPHLNSPEKLKDYFAEEKSIPEK